MSEGRKQEFVSFGWNPDEIPDPQAIETFMQSKLDWGEIARQPHAELLQWHRELIGLRKQSGDLTDGRLDQVDVKFDEAARWLTMRRGSILVVVNFAQEARDVPLTNSERTKKVVLASRSGVVTNTDSVRLTPESVAIIRT
ncbi:MAG TPA: DUF3459 domain-containing protein [Candidatus Binataceae bacterium]|nr:DUF3459 domain-containing protein [Candidatus Binataceae bacterium]